MSTPQRERGGGGGGGRERGESEIQKFDISLWHIDKHGILLVRERERERERERDFKISYIVLAHSQAVCIADCLVNSTLPAEVHYLLDLFHYKDSDMKISVADSVVMMSRYVLYG